MFFNKEIDMAHILFLFVLILSSYTCFGALDPTKVIIQFEQKFYHPEKYKLDEVVFTAEVSNLAKMLNSVKNFGEIKDVKFKVYWIYPGKYKIDIIGMPKGFKEIKNDLKSLLAARLDFVIPNKLSVKTRSYKFEVQQKSSGVIHLKGEDPTHHREINRIDLTFSKDNILTTLKMRSPAGEKVSTFEMSEKDWSQGKKVINRIIVKGRSGSQTSILEYNIKYKKVGKFGFPSQVDITTFHDLHIPKSTKSKKKARTTESSIKFYDYKVNSGEALKYISNGTMKVRK